MEKNAWNTLETTGKRPGTAAIFLFTENRCEMLEKSSKELGSQESSHPNKDLLSTTITPPVPAACWVELMKHARAEAPERCPAFGSCLGKMELTVWRRVKRMPHVDRSHECSCLQPPFPLSFTLLYFLPFIYFFFSFYLYSIFSFFAPHFF